MWKHVLESITGSAARQLTLWPGRARPVRPILADTLLVAAFLLLSSWLAR